MVTSIPFKRGTGVEVTSDEDGFRGAWYEGTIIEPPSKKHKKALVEYKHIVTDDGSTPLKERFDPACIRPLPPLLQNELLNFEENDMVEVHYGDGWWIGTVRKVLDNGGKLRVYFDNPPDMVDYEVKDLRVHWDWVDGKWVRPEKQFQKSTASVFRSGADVQVNLDHVWFPGMVVKQNEDATFFVKCEIDGDEPIKANLDSHHIRAISESKQVLIISDDNQEQEITPTKKKMKFNNASGLLLSGRASRRNPKETTVATTTDIDRTGANPEFKVYGRKSAKSEFKRQFLGSAVNGKDGKKKQAQMPKIVLGLKASKAMITDTQAGNPSRISDDFTGQNSMPKETTAVDQVHSTELLRMESADCPYEFGRKTAEVPLVDMAVAAAVDDDVQPLSTWIGSGKTFNGLISLVTETQSGILNDSPAIHVKCGSRSSTPMLQNEALPFVKKSPVWETIESMQVFQILPQNPHFRALDETKVTYREGSAIGAMVTFASLFEKISMLKFDDSSSVFHSTLDDLLDLDKHGFDVTLLRNRVNELLSLRDVQEQVLDESKVAQREIIEQTDAMTKLDKEMEDVIRKMNDLKGQLDSAKLEKKRKDVELARLQSDAEGINARIRSARYDFQKLATAPWKLL